jgi:hypothetical protein
MREESQNELITSTFAWFAGCLMAFFVSLSSRRGRWLASAALILGLFFLLWIPPARASGFQPQVSARSDGALLINNRLALRIPVSADGLTPSQRAGDIARRIARLSLPQKTRVVPINRRSIAIETAGGALIVVVTRADARSEGMRLGTLASRWASSIGSLLALPPLTLSTSPGTIIVPTGQTRAVSVGGAAPANAVSAQGTAQSTAKSSYDPGNRRLTIQGIKAGHAQVVVTATDGQGGQAQKVLTVVVEDPAANIGREADARVTGSPTAPKDLVIQAVYNALYRIVAPKEGAKIELLESPDITKDLPAGQTVTIVVPIRATGPSLVTVEAKPTVTITNDDTVPVLTAASLFYSNDPEQVKGPQPLFCASLPSLSKPVRLVYHHVNSAETPLVLRIELVNFGQVDSTIHLLQGRAGPGPDPILTGYKAGEQFLHGLQGNVGLVLTIPAGSRMTLMADRLPKGQTMSGYIQMAQVGDEASDLLLRVIAEPASANTPCALDPLVHPINGGSGAYPLVAFTKDDAASFKITSLSEEVYESPTVPVSGDYRVGSGWLYLNLGTKHAISRKDRRDTLDGNYGVEYIYTVTLENPTNAPRTIAIQFLAQAGPAAGLFLIDNTRWVDLDPSQGIDEEVARTTLPPGQSQTMEIKTIPLSGSAYPVSLIAHAL